MPNDELHKIFSDRMEKFEDSSNATALTMQRLIVSIDEMKEMMKRLEVVVTKYEDKSHKDDIVREMMVRDYKELKDDVHNLKQSMVEKERNTTRTKSKLAWILIGMVVNILSVLGYTLLIRTGILKL